MDAQIKKYITRKLKHVNNHIHQVLDEIYYELPCPARFIIQLFIFLISSPFKHPRTKEQ